MIPEEMEDEIEALDKDAYYDQLYDYYLDVKEKDGYDYDGGKKGGTEQDSVISLDRTTKWPNIEIKPEMSLFETSPILMMTGSALVLVHTLISLGWIMLA